MNISRTKAKISPTAIKRSATLGVSLALMLNVGMSAFAEGTAYIYDAGADSEQKGSFVVVELEDTKPDVSEDTADSTTSTESSEGSIISTEEATDEQKQVAEAAEQLLDDLEVTDKFAVYADTLVDEGSHVEGNIAVNELVAEDGTFEGVKGGSILNDKEQPIEPDSETTATDSSDDKADDADTAGTGQTNYSFIGTATTGKDDTDDDTVQVNINSDDMNAVIINGDGLRVQNAPEDTESSRGFKPGLVSFDADVDNESNLSADKKESDAVELVSGGMIVTTDSDGNISYEFNDEAKIAIKDMLAKNDADADDLLAKGKSGEALSEQEEQKLAAIEDELYEQFEQEVQIDDNLDKISASGEALMSAAAQANNKAASTTHDLYSTQPQVKSSAANAFDAVATLLTATRKDTDGNDVNIVTEDDIIVITVGLVELQEWDSAANTLRTVSALDNSNDYYANSWNDLIAANRNVKAKVIINVDTENLGREATISFYEALNSNGEKGEGYGDAAEDACDYFVWNFGDYEGGIKADKHLTGEVVAAEAADVRLGRLNGKVIADHVTMTNEIHQTYTREPAPTVEPDEPAETPEVPSETDTPYTPDTPEETEQPQEPTSTPEDKEPEPTESPNVPDIPEETEQPTEPETPMPTEGPEEPDAQPTPAPSILPSEETVEPVTAVEITEEPIPEAVIVEPMPTEQPVETVQNHDGKLPQTGDASPYWIASLVVSGLGLMLLGFFTEKKCRAK